ncbi:MAG: hypothetical protein ACLVCE_03365 [Anaerovoracaceae bacterium]
MVDRAYPFFFFLFVLIVCKLLPELCKLQFILLFLLPKGRHVF